MTFQRSLTPDMPMAYLEKIRFGAKVAAWPFDSVISNIGFPYPC